VICLVTKLVTSQVIFNEHMHVQYNTNKKASLANAKVKVRV